MYTKKRQLEFQVVFISYLLLALFSGFAALLILKASGKLSTDFFYGSFLINVALPLAVSVVITLYVILRKFNYHFQRMNFPQCALRAFRETALLASCWAVLLIFAKNGVSASRYFYATTLLIYFLLLTIEWKYISSVIVNNFYKTSFATYVGVITNSKRAERVIHTLKKDWARKLVGICLVDMDDAVLPENVCKVPVSATVGTLVEHVRKNAIDEVFVEVEEFERPLVQDAIKEMICMGIRVHVNVPEICRLERNFTEKALYEISEQSQESMPEETGIIEHQTVYTRELKYGYGGRPVLILDRPRRHIRQQIMKRTIDIIGSIIGLAFTGILFLILGPMIKKDSPGPVLFGQIRIGKNGRKFKMYKFRSMYQDAEARKKELMDKNEMNGLMFKIENDPRITKVGRFIRKTSLDEFPQFWNVLKGDMSLVGTRPPTVSEFNQYNSFHKRRLSMKPGITGLWQVSGRSDIKDFEEVVRLDCQYIDNWSVSEDIKILFKTISLVFKKDNGAA